MNRFLLAAGMVMLATTAQAQNLSGRYEVQGTNLNGSTYGGTAEIVPTSNTTCTIEWRTGSTTSRGICMRQGDVFVAGYRMGEAVGLAVYRWRNDGGFLDGTWTIAGQRGTGTERLIPMR